MEDACPPIMDFDSSDDTHRLTWPSCCEHEVTGK